MTEQLKVLATKSDVSSSVPRTHMVKRKNQFLQIVLWSLDAHHGTSPTPPEKKNKQMYKRKS